MRLCPRGCGSGFGSTPLGSATLPVSQNTESPVVYKPTIYNILSNYCIYTFMKSLFHSSYISAAPPEDCEEKTKKELE